MTLIEDTRARLGAIGAWLPSAPMTPPPDVERAATQRLADAGYRSVWSGEGPGTREVFACFGDLLATVPDVVLGTGAGHAFQAAKLGEDHRPLDRLSEVDNMAAERLSSIAFRCVPARVGPRTLSRDHADSTRPFAQPISPAPYAREILGPYELPIPQQTEPAGSREDARESVRRRLSRSAARGRRLPQAVRRGVWRSSRQHPGERVPRRTGVPAAPTFESTVETLLDLAVEVTR